MTGFLDRPAPDSAVVDGVEVRRGSRVRVRPREGGDLLDIALAGRVAVVESVEQDTDERLHLAVTFVDDPGRDLGESSWPGHRFFFALDEVEPLGDAPLEPVATARVLVAGIGNVFLGDDGFGVEVARRLAERPQPAGVRVADYGIRGMDLACALQEQWAAVVLVDAVARGERPGTLSVIEPSLAEGDVAVDAHGMDPAKVLRLTRALGAEPPRTLVVGCEPATHMTGEEADVLVQLSPPVAAVVENAIALVEDLVADLINQEEQ